MWKTFVSHPFKDNPKENKEKVEIICDILYREHGLLPISPLHLFSFIDEETDGVRDMIMDSCFKLIAFDSKQLFAFGTEGGCADEILWAKTLNIPVYYKKLIKEDGEYKILDVC